jgi:putative peptidoglycan lipid II flippase
VTLTAGRRIANAALLIAGGNVLSRLLGFVREPVIAALFGATGNADALEIATRIPQFVHELVIGGAVSGALIPVFSELAGDQKALRRTYSTVMGSVILVAGVSVIVLMLLAEPLVDLAAIGLQPETRELAVTMTRITLPALVFLAVSAITSARLYSRDRFAFPAFSTASLNATLIVFALALTPVVGPPGVAIGYLVGAAMHLMVQVPGLIRDRAGLTRPAWMSDPNFRQIVRLYVPIAAGLFVAQILVVVDANLASRTGEGSLATMRFATRLQQLPLGLIATAISLAFLPTLARNAPPSTRRLAVATEFRRRLAMAAKTAFLLIVPITVLLTTLSLPIIRLVYERGAFTEGATDSTAHALVIYAMQLPLTALDQIFIVAFYAMRNTITPVIVGVVSGLVYLATALLLVEPYGVFGLVTANTVQNSFHGIVLGLILWWLLRGTIHRDSWLFVAKLAFAGGVMALVALGLREIVREGIELDAREGWATLLIAGGAALAVYGGMLACLRIDEIAGMRTVVVQMVDRFKKRSA